MISLQSIHELPLHEKLMVMEALWDDLSAAETDLEMPLWQKDLLVDREAAFKAGKASFVDWEEAKKDILHSVR